MASIIQGLFGGGGSNTNPGLFGGGGSVVIPPFLASGAITPEQTSLAEYTGGEGHLAQDNLFGGSGTGMSTMATQGNAGVDFAEGKQKGQMSDVDQTAAYDLYQNDVHSQLAQLAIDAKTQAQSANEIGALVGAAGKAFGASGGTFGG
jgi:hypothetical protein